jgi:hypothetical protein
MIRQFSATTYRLSAVSMSPRRRSCDGTFAAIDTMWTTRDPRTAIHSVAFTEASSPVFENAPSPTPDSGVGF